MTESGKISFWTAVLMSINIIVGGGIFAGPQSMAAIAGNLSFMTWFLAAILVFPIVWGVARAAVVFPGTGGFYHYGKTGINADFGFLSHWFYLLGYVMGTASAMTFLLRNALATRLGWSFAAEHPYVSNALILVLFSLLNLMPIGIVSKMQAGATLLKLLPLLIITGLTFWYFNPALDYDFSHLNTLPATIPTVIFGYLGFEACCSLSHLLKDGPSSVGKVVLVAFFITAVLYMIFHFGLLQVMGAEQLAAVGAIAFPDYLGLSAHWTLLLGVIVGGAILLSYANSLFGLSLGNITNIIAISRGSKMQAALIHGVAIWLLLCFMSDINNIFAFTVVGVGIAYCLTLVAVFRYSIQIRDNFQAFIMLLGFVSCAVMFYCCWVGLGGDALGRILNLSPILIGGIVGFILYRVGLLKI